MSRHLGNLGRVTASAGMLMLILVSWGCGSSDLRNAKDRAFVKGKVTLGKRPLRSGIVIFTDAHGWKEQTRTMPDGSYRMPIVPIGEVKVGVQSITPPANRPRRLSGSVKVPPRYNDPETSGLTFTVTAGGGEQEINIALTP